MIKKIKIELIVLLLLLINIFLSSSLDLHLYSYFNDFDKNLNTIFLKDFFVNITTLGDSFWYFFFCVLGIVVVFIFEKTKLLIFKSLKEIQRVCPSGKAHITVESYRNESEKANLLDWQLTCETFYTPKEWEWFFSIAGYKGDYGCIYFQ